MATPFVDVLVPVALDQTYSYRVPREMDSAPATSSPCRSARARRSAWSGPTTSRSQPGLHNRMKDVELKLDYPPLKPELRKFVDWVSELHAEPARHGAAHVPAHGRSRARRARRSACGSPGPPPKRMTAGARRVLALLADGMVRAKSEAAHEAGVSAGVIDGLIDEGALETLVLPPEPVARQPDPDFAVPEFTDAQRAAADALRASVEQGRLLRDAGRRRHRLGQDRGLFRGGRRGDPARQAGADPDAGDRADRAVPRPLRRAVRRPPAEWHSELAPRKRARTWAAVAAGEVQVVVGARSALFLPYADLGLIIVDEEHDPAYKQEDGVRYHARDMAVVRAREIEIPIVLASATPSVETEVNARRGRYAHLHLPERFGGQHLPSVEAIDLRREGPPRGRFISPRLAEAVKIALERSEQALLFLNRRGFAPLTLCNACGHRMACPNCDAWLVDHRFKRRLVCHHCGYSMPPPEQCPKCEAKGSFVAVGPGVERLEQEAAELFPDARILVLSSDLVESMERLRQELDDVAQGRFDIVIGTQLVAKGHHFPKLNLVGIVDADLGLANGDPARRRAHVPASASGGRPRRPRGRAAATAFCRRISPSIR